MIKNFYQFLKKYQFELDDKFLNQRAEVYKQNSIRLLLAICLTGLLFNPAIVNKVNAQTETHYSWDNVVIGSGGFVPGIIYSKAEQNLIYARTDVGGAYRWEPASRSWIPLSDHVGHFNELGVFTMAADPVDAKRVYMVVGLYEQDWWGVNSRFYASNDKGNTWTVSDLPFKVGGNDPGRSSGERLQVDPNKNNILYMGSNTAGLWKSTDFGATWTQDINFPFTKITFVEFDKSTGTAGNPTGTIYVGVHDHLPNTHAPAIYYSVDAGENWAPVPGQPIHLPAKSWDANEYPAVANNVALAGNYLYVSYSSGISPNGDYRINPGIENGAVFRYNTTTGEWRDITPSRDSQGGYGGISVDPSNPDFVLVGTLERWWPQNELHITNNGGISWNTVLHANTWSNEARATFDVSKAPYVAAFRPHWLGAVEIDPFNPSNAMFGTGYGIFGTTDLIPATWGGSTHWVFESENFEETVPLSLVSPPTGAHLVSAIGDFGGFRHDNFEHSPLAGGHVPYGGTTTSIAFAENKPQVMVRAYSSGNIRGSYSTDGAITWTEFSSRPANAQGQGHISISADGNIIVWTANNADMAFSTNLGNTWTVSNGVPRLKPVADRANNNVFYAFQKTSGTLYWSENGAADWSIANSSIPRLEGWEDGGDLYAVPGNAGHLWLALGKHGLYRSTDYGVTFEKADAVSAAFLVSSGKPAPSRNYPAIFIYGVIGEWRGLFRSDDEGATWVQINDENNRFGNYFRTITGDPRVYGRVYVGTQGRGIVYGELDPSQINTPPVAEFAASLVSGYGPLEVKFDASASTDADGDELQYFWNFGDGKSGSGVIATHIYTAPGVYEATLTVKDGRGGEDAGSVQITVKSGLSLQYKLRPNNAKPFDNHIKPHFNIVNTSDKPVTLKDLAIRYYYTKEGNAAEVFHVDYAALGNHLVKGAFIPMENSVATADHYLEVSFTSNGTIPAGGNSGEIQIRFNKVDWSNYDETNDYSYNQEPQFRKSFQDWEQITLYLNGELYWGVEPSSNKLQSFIKADGAENVLNNKKLEIYPNPVDGSTLHINSYLNGKSHINVQIFNTIGTLVFSKDLGVANEGGQYHSLDISSLPKGTYVLRLISGEGVENSTLIKQ